MTSQVRRIGAAVRLAWLRGRKLARIARRPAWWRAARLGVAPSLELERIEFAFDHRTVIDVGAGRGQFALLARWRFPAARLHCFEPGAASFATLHAVLDGDLAAACTCVAAGAAEGSGVLHVASDADSSSLLAFDRQEAVMGTAEVGSEPVRIAPLDALLPASWERPALLKIDVQGSEVEVLAGASRVLDAVDELLVEVSYVSLYRDQSLAGEVIGRLWEAGFTLVGDYVSARDARGSAVQSDLRFLRRAGSMLGVGVH